MTIIAFPREYKPTVEAFSVRDRTNSRRFFVFDLVGRDEYGPYRLDVGHFHTLDEVAEAAAAWWRDGIEVRDAGMFP